VKATTGTRGAHSAAAMAAGSAYPMVASPLEVRSRRGSGTSHSGIATSMCAPASTVAMVSAGVQARAVATTCCGASSPGEATATAASRAAASALAARPTPGGQSWPGPAASTRDAWGSGIRNSAAPVK
jgi:hypothetical protein